MHQGNIAGKFTSYSKIKFNIVIGKPHIIYGQDKGETISYMQLQRLLLCQKDVQFWHTGLFHEQSFFAAQ